MWLRSSQLQRLVVMLYVIVVVRFLLFAWTWENAWMTPTGGPTTSLASRSAHQRLVFSFTTTSKGIDKLKPTLRSILDQSGPSFDAVYVIVPTFYRETRVEIPQWLVTPATQSRANASSSFGWNFTVVRSDYDARVRVVVNQRDFGPASKLLGALLVEQEPETIIVYGDDDRLVPKQLTSRVLFYADKYANDALAVMGGWIGQQKPLYCGRSLDLGVNSVSFVAGAGAVAVRRKFYDRSAFDVMKLSRPCFLGDDFYLSFLLHRRGVNKRLVMDSCWNPDHVPPSYNHMGLSMQDSPHPGGSNVENYQQCMREVGNGLALDGEFGYTFMNVFSQLWGVFRAIQHAYRGEGFIPC